MQTLDFEAFWVQIAKGHGLKAFKEGGWNGFPGIVYLMRCAETGVCKVGGSINPVDRLRNLRVMAKKRYGFKLVYVWSIITNGVGRLEGCWLQEWSKYRRQGIAREWFLLPESEVTRFRSFSCIQWKGLPEVPEELKVRLQPPSPESCFWKVPGPSTRKLKCPSGPIATLSSGRT